MPKWRNRQTRYVQGVVGATPWEFKSPLRHHVDAGPTGVSSAHSGRSQHVHMRRDLRKFGAWSLARMRARGKSGLQRARVPGESRGSGRQRPLTVQIGTRLARESNRDQTCLSRVKRAILPAAISDSAASRLLAEAGSREPSRRRRRDRHLSREMTIPEQNPAYPLSFDASSLRCL